MELKLRRPASREANPRAAAIALPAAASHPVVDLVTGALTPATILGAHSAAVVLCCEVPGSPRPARVVTVLTQEASGVPNGVRTALRAADGPFGHAAVGDAAFVGGGGVQLAGLHFRIVRTIRTAVPHIVAAPDAVDRLARAAALAARGVADEPVARLRAALAGGDVAGLRAAARALVGLGAGSTPGGDDVLAGTLAGLIAVRRGVLAHRIAAAIVPDLQARTPLMSADLLRLAAQGHVCTEAGAVLRAVARRDGRGGPGEAAADVDRAVDRLIAIGHTSGADLATGLAIGLSVPDQPPPRRPRRSRRARVRKVSAAAP